MKSPRDWEWTNEALLYEDRETFDYFFGTLMGGVGSIVPSLLLGAAVDGLGVAPVFGVLIAITFFLVGTSHMFWVPLINRWHAVDNSRAKSVGYAYRALSREDRKEYFPTNFESLIKSFNQMSPPERESFLRRSEEILGAIRTRDKLLAQAAVRHIDLTDAMHELDRGKEKIATTVDTYRQYL